MMKIKKSHIMLSLILASATLSAQTNIKWQENFNDVTIPAGWQVIDADGSGSGLQLVQTESTPDGTDISPHAGQSFWTSSARNANLPGEIDEWLISPRISVIYAGDSLFFWAGAVDQGFDDSLRVKVSTTDNRMSSFTNQLANIKVDGPAGSWHRYGFDLAQFDSMDIYFAINYYIKDGGPGGQHSDFVWIDDALISGDPGSLNNPPTIVHLKEPANDGYININTPVFDFTWTASQDLDAEDLEYTLTILNAFPQMNFTVVSDTSYTMEWQDVLNENFKYLWTIKVTDGISKVASPDTFSFEIADPAAIPINSIAVPGDPVLQQNYPNPFNPVTNIEFQIAKSEFVTLKVYNLQGMEVATLVSENLPSGNHSYIFNAKNLSSGVYYYRLQTGKFQQIKKMILIK